VALGVNGKAVRERTGRRVDGGEYTATADDTALRLKVEGVDGMSEAFDKIKSAAVRAPG
jgi:hypothetical protein